MQGELVNVGSIHRHTGGLEMSRVEKQELKSIHRHTGGLEMRR